MGAKKNDNLVGQGFHTNPERINKKGQPRKLPEINAIYLQAVTEADLVALFAKARQMGARGNIKAIEWLFDRIYGKAKQNLGFTDKEGNDISPITFVLDERYKKADPGKDDTGIPT